MDDPEIRINILPEKSELHFFIEQLADMTPDQVAVLVEHIAGILRTLPDKPFSQLRADDPELIEGNASSHHADLSPQLMNHIWN